MFESQRAVTCRGPCPQNRHALSPAGLVPTDIGEIKMSPSDDRRARAAFDIGEIKMSPSETTGVLAPLSTSAKSRCH